MASCVTDRLVQTRIRYCLENFLAQHVCAIALGYEDVNGHDQLRHDPTCKILSNPWTDERPSALAGKSTLNRLERSWENGDQRYHMLTPNLKQLSDRLVELFLDSYTSIPERIILDIDAKDIKTHGSQEFSAFHGYYEHRCFLPLSVFAGRYLSLAQLRPSNIGRAQGARNQIRRFVTAIRKRWFKLKSFFAWIQALPVRTSCVERRQ